MTDPEVWEKLRAPFPADEIELLPKPFSRDAQKSKCTECGGYHGLPAVHLSYVGHAGITMRLNEVVGPDGWNWEPLATTEVGTPLFNDGGLWIKLTVLEVARIGYGDSGGKSFGPNAVKEIIGDAIRNAAMRFGIGTYLWSKSEKAQAQLTQNGADDEPTHPQQAQTPPPEQQQQRTRPPASKRGPAGDEMPATRKQIGMIQGLFKELGYTDEQRQDKLTMCATIIGGRIIESSNELTKGEASQVIDALDKKVKAQEQPFPDEPPPEDQ